MKANTLHLLLDIAADVRPQHRALIEELRDELPDRSVIELVPDSENPKLYVAPPEQEHQAKYFGTVKPATPSKPVKDK